MIIQSKMSISVCIWLIAHLWTLPLLYTAPEEIRSVPLRALTHKLSATRDLTLHEQQGHTPVVRVLQVEGSGGLHRRRLAYVTGLASNETGLLLEVGSCKMIHMGEAQKMRQNCN